MQRELVVKGLSLGGSSDLTLLAPLRAGLVESLESMTYRTRTKRTLQALHAARMNTHEYTAVHLISDAVERITAIQSVRVAVFDETDTVMLSVSFDGSWEAYIRVLWDKVGTLLDLIFCNTVGYVTAREHSFDDWEAWARRVQIETGFFYGPPDTTARDVLYHRRVERMNGRLAYEQLTARAPGPPPAEAQPDTRPLQSLRASLPSAEEEVRRVVDPPRPLNPDDPPYTVVLQSRMVRERVRSGVQGLAALYRLTDLYRPGTSDGEVLRHAAINLLDEFVRMRDNGLIDDELRDEHDGPRDAPDRLTVEEIELVDGRFRRQLDWLLPDAKPALPPRPIPLLEPVFQIPASVRADTQAGILHSYPRINCGLVLLLAFDDRQAAAALLETLLDADAGMITSDASLPGSGTPEFKNGVCDQVYRHLSFTPAGLRAAGLNEDELELFDEEFRQGMAGRAGLLGDVQANHPRRWRLPVPRTPAGGTAAPGTGVDLGAVHAVLQLRCQTNLKTLGPDDVPKALQAEIDRILALKPQPRILAQQSLRRYYAKVQRDGEDIVEEHYGYADGDGQPEIEWSQATGEFKRNRVALGEVLLGHANTVEEPLAARCPHVQQLQQRRLDWQRNGSYLVMRKYRQQVDAFNRAVAETAEAMVDALAKLKPPRQMKVEDCIEIVRGRLMGRQSNGRAVISTANPGKVNAFTYDLDPQGEECPLHAHIRRAHPRSRPGELVRPPRLMRRSMSYGPRLDAGQAMLGDKEERGLLFMAYNASLGEQFEVVQRWLVGGNSTGSTSGVSCPIVGTPATGLARHFRFEYAGLEFAVRLDPPQKGQTAFDEPDVMTRLDWGLYLFSPSLGALRKLQERAAGPGRAVPWKLDLGRQILQRLQQVESQQGADAALEAWKAAIEDPEAIDRMDSAALWAAIRADHGGLLRTPYGVLVADRELAGNVYLDPQRRYSVCGQLDRMRASFGEIALGMDESTRYRELATAVNTAIGQLTKDEVFNCARDAVQRRLNFIWATGQDQSRKVGDLRMQSGFDARELLDEVLASLSESWFGIQDGPDPDKPLFGRGPTDWHWQTGQPPLYPGHFTALSRYMFQPHPGAVPTELGQAYGRALRVAMRDLVSWHRKNKTLPRAPILSGCAYAGRDAPLAAAVFNDPNHTKDPAVADDLIARTLVGVLMGFNPTITGAVLNVLAEWYREDLFAPLRLKLLQAGACTLQTAEAVLGSAVTEALRMRPMPQVGWRTALVDHRLGDEQRHAVDVRAGERVVMSIVSGTQQSLADGLGDGRLMFGGVRGGPAGTYPTHACPGYEAGIGAILGSLAGLLAWTDCTELRPGPGPFSFMLEARVPPFPPPPAPEPTPADSAERVAPPPKGRLVSADDKGNDPLIMAWGDSWLDFPLDTEDAIDLRDWLAGFGYAVPETYCKYSVWPKSSTMAARTGPFCEDLDARLLSSQIPVAILLSAGGNDSTGDALKAILKALPNGSTTLPIDDAKLDAHIAGIRRNYETVIDAILRVQDDHGMKIPIVVHGYDNPIPRGHGVLGLPYAKKWMFLPFQSVGIDCDTPAGLDIGKATMKHLITELNDMLRDLTAAGRFAGRVFHVRLQETIKSADEWNDDLHPTPEAFGRLAVKVHEEIVQVRGLVAAPKP